ncbi:hypothetical protein C9994_03200 [Marivirga lumbricoides]|uniref:Uncharacterized protein n=1 Tax=Marivirga lumbricoides TaxID=1046115 RepID=A0A2T4DU39_9BACT|nr:hypothetical protein C9994_03200 [Marivirga lumbricoides]
MKKKRTYQEDVEKLFKAIDISIESYKTYPPKDWTQDIVKMVTSNLEKDKLSIINAEPKFRTLASLKYDIEAVFTYFQEATGETVEYFWKKIDEAGLDFKRENKLEKILDRGKIRGRIEYEYVTDMIIVAEQVGMTSKEETKRLSDMLGNYEARKRK